MGKLNDAVRRLIESLQISSASPGHINEVLQLDPSIDLDQELEDATSETGKKKESEIQSTVQKVKNFDGGQVGEINRMASAQFGNLRQFARNPFTFITGTVFRKFARGAGVVALAVIIFEAVKFIISELLKPGRLLDIRFKRDIRDEIIAFRRREDQQKLKQGVSNIIITTMSGLRGGQNQFVNTLDLTRTSQFPATIGQSSILIEASGVSFSKNKGKKSRNFGGGLG